MKEGKQGRLRTPGLSCVRTTDPGKAFDIFFALKWIESFVDIPEVPRIGKY
jgi:hypothetical protein